MKAQGCSLSHRSLALARAVALSILSTALALGCGNDGDRVVAPPEEDLFVVCGFVFNPDGSLLNVVYVTDTIGPDASLDLETGSELNGRCVVQGEDLFIGSADSPVLTRYAISEAGVPEETGRFSFAPAGLGSISTRPARFQFFSDTKAYLIDPANQQVVIWNPRDMELVGTFEIPGLSPPEGFTVRGIGGIARVGNQVIVPFWQVTTDDVTAPRTAFAFIDGDTDSVTVDVVTTCGGPNWSKVTASGDVYFAQGGATVAAHIAGIPGTSPQCMLRVNSGQNEVDDSFVFSPNSYTGAPTAALLPGPGDSSYVIAYDESLGPAPGGLDPTAVLFAPAWRLHFVDEIGVSTTATLVNGVEPVAGRPTAFLIDDRTYLSLGAADFSSSTLVDVTDPQAPVTGATAPGVVESVFRLRRSNSELSGRMAQRIEPRSGPSLLPFSDFGN